MSLPSIQKADLLSNESWDRRLFIASEGFEARSLSWIASQPEEVLFRNAIICKYTPSKKSRFNEISQEVKKRTCEDVIILAYNRFAPTPFEVEFEETLIGLLPQVHEIIIDISAMSKLLIMILLHVLRAYDGTLRIIYSEPRTWSPTEAEFIQKKPDLEQGAFVSLSSVGVYNIVRTPGLSSVVMQDSPALLVAFASTNGHLVNAVANEVTPSLTLLINSKNTREPWREVAALDIQRSFIKDFPMYPGEIQVFDLIDYKSVFEYLAEIYRTNCYDRRIIIAPTGGKLHTVACALLKNCCSDVHIEYPTPESYIFDAYSSEEIYAMHQIIFPNFANLFRPLSEEYELNG